MLNQETKRRIERRDWMTKKGIEEKEEMGGYLKRILENLVLVKKARKSKLLGN